MECIACGQSDLFSIAVGMPIPNSRAVLRVSVHCKKWSARQELTVQFYYVSHVLANTLAKLAILHVIEYE